MTSMFTLSIMGDQLVIDLHSPEPSYQQLARQLRERIRDGRIGPRAPLPSITQLTGEPGLAVGTVRHAISVLVDEGYAYTVPGRGTYAAETLPDLQVSACGCVVIWPRSCVPSAAENQLPRAGAVWQPAAGPGRRCRLSEGRREVSEPVAGAFLPALFTAQPRSTTRARLFFTQWRVHFPPR